MIRFRFRRSQWLIALILMLVAFSLMGHFVTDATCAPSDTLHQCLAKRVNGAEPLAACCTLHTCFLLPYASIVFGLSAFTFTLHALDLVFFTHYLSPPLHPPDVPFRLA